MTKHRRLLAKTGKVVPWSHLLSIIEWYDSQGERGRPPIGVEWILQIYFPSAVARIVRWSMEDTLHDGIVICADGIDLTVENATAAITQLNLLRLLIAHELPRKLFGEIDLSLADRGQMMKVGTLVHAVIIEARPPTKNPQKNRSTDVHQTKKGNEWCFEVKAHVGVDSDVWLVRSVADRPTNLLDMLQAHALLYGPEENTPGNRVCLDVDKRDKMKGTTGKSQVAKRG